MRLRSVAVVGLVACGGGGSTPPPTAPIHADHEQHTHGHHHRFDDAARWAKVFDDPARDQWQKPDRVLSLLRLEPGMNVADIGAGTGYFEPHLSRAVGQRGSVLAIDVEPSMVQWLTERMRREGFENVSPKLGAPDDPKIPDGSVERILIVDTWHHIDDRGAYAKKIAKALTKGGAVFVVDFTKEAPHGPPPAFRLPPELIVRELEGAGLGESKIHLPDQTGLPYQYVVEAMKTRAGP